MNFKFWTQTHLKGLELANQNTVWATENPEKTEMEPALTAARDAIAGQYFVKKKAQTYLPHPSLIDSLSEEAKSHYNVYLASAEFDEFPAATQRAMLGKLELDESQVQLPSKIAYLEEDVDGDGTSIYSAMSFTTENVLVTKWQLLVSDFQGLTDIDITQLSKEDARKLNARSTVKQYVRESVVDWQFDRVNGRMQLTYIKLLEVSLELDRASLKRKSVQSYVILALDEDGFYFQQKVVQSGKNAGWDEGERTYPEVNGSKLTYIPAVIVADEPEVSGHMPLELGYVNSVIEQAYARYRMSADYKAVLRNLIPTMFTSGWTKSSIDTFKEANNGRSTIVMGSSEANNLPDKVTAQIVSAQADVTGYENYFKTNADKVRALGGVFDTEDRTQMTATEAVMLKSEQNALLNNIVFSLEEGFEQAIKYCAVFEGLYPPEQAHQKSNEIEINIPKGFSAIKLTPEELRAIGELVIMGLKTREDAIALIEQGGWSLTDAQAEIDSLIEGGGINGVSDSETQQE